MVARSAEKFADIPNGSSAYITFLVVDAKGKIDTRGHDFIDVSASDGTQTVSVKVWDTVLSESGIEIGKVLRGHVDSKEYRGATSYSMRTYAQDSEHPASAFIVNPPVPIEDMRAWIENRIRAMKEPYRAVAHRIMAEQGDAYAFSAAGRSIHHAFIGGLLYHSYRMAKAAEILCDIYGGDRDLVVCGCILHDIGKLECLKTGWSGQADYTATGHLEDHSLCGTRIVETAARAEEVADTEEIRTLIHIIASHQAKQEYGAIVEPMTREALMVSMLDMMDMQQEICDEQLKSVEAGQFTLNPVAGLDRKLYRPAI